MARTRISLVDLATTLGLAVSTVSRALSGHSSVSEATRQRVHRLAKQLDYQPNPFATALRTGVPRVLGVVVPRIDGPGMAAALQAIETAAGRAGFQLMVCQSQADAGRERKTVSALVRARVDGVLVAPVPGQCNVGYFNRLHEQEIPLVCFGLVPEGLLCPVAPPDDYHAARYAVEQLLAQGCRRIVHLAGPHHLPSTQRRHQAYLDALASRGLPYAEGLVWFCPATQEADASTEQELRRYASLADAFFVSHTLTPPTLARVLEHLKATGSGSEAPNPRLVTLPQNYDQVGTAATQLLLRQLTRVETRPFASSG
ncbi:LacI family DNA-binding transcriptional regulator [Hymenobacter weizhouensis]|uniref:LacI family DNA-binding transcriptional regulator n=1 Tax=Hymenobacter sp. YIM 151500-1 TaxID=2987689 RepID=UPI00222608AD|nr:LacI family DNA-binding transcriptional regulator [Hymenobacter sp. YIM 151500-1]UYZ62393.1 LacI family transcriptional regulator [Hymenobacter sp. YIM 151500-1]